MKNLLITMRIIFFTLLISLVVLQECSAQCWEPPNHKEFFDTLSKTSEQYNRELKALFDTLQRSIPSNYDKHKVEEFLIASKLCSDEIANTTLKSQSLENSLQLNIDKLEKKLQDTVDQLSHINKTCKCRAAAGENFQKIGNKFYRFENKLKLNWFSAYKRCQKLGAHLSSLQEEDELEKLMGNLTETDYWLGINDLAMPDEYRVASTNQRATVLFWDAGEPQNDDGESHCVKLQRDVSDYAMSTSGCRLRYNFICEKFVFEEPK